MSRKQQIPSGKQKNIYNMQDKTKYAIEGSPGEWIIKQSWVSDLDFIMIAFWNEETGVTMNVNTRTKLEEALKFKWISKINPEGTNPPDISIIY